MAEDAGGVGEYDFLALAQPGLRRLKSYDPGHDIVALRRRFGARLVELGGNENPHGPSPRAREAILDALGQLARYPDPLGGDLKAALAKRLGVDTAQILLGNGSHELLMQFAQAFCGPEAGVVMSRYGFAVYPLAALAADAPLTVAEALPEGHPMHRGHDLGAIRAAVDERTRVVYLCNPSNPVGTWFPTADLERFLASLPGHVLVVVDEAYAEYVEVPELRSALTLMSRFPRLIVTRTFSKGYGLAGLRVGYAVAQAGLVAVMERLRESFNVNLLGLAAAEAALADEEHLAWHVAQNRIEREWLAGRLRDRGFYVHPSQTNFLLVDFGRDAMPYEEALLAQGVVPRPMRGYGLPTCLRISIGTRSENHRLLSGLENVGA